MDINEILIGTDPELFVSNGTNVVSAEGLIGGTKSEPKYITEEGHAIQEDNVMVEFNTPPCKTATQFKNEINLVLTHLDAVVGLHGLKLHYSASEELDPKYLDTEQAKTFGCEPDFNVYLQQPNNPPEPSGYLRTCGGHIHVGYPNPSVGKTEKIIKAMDLFLGVPSILMDTDDRRKTMYGKAGAFRFKKYGTEYRTLSNFWIHTDELKEWAFNSTINALKFIQNKENVKTLKKLENTVVSIINSNDKEAARELLSNFEEVVVIEKKNLIEK